MSLIIFLIVLSILVMVHECGHYMVARLFGVKVEEFGYGFPPRLLGFVRSATGWKRVKIGDRQVHTRTIWSLNWLPLGGFVRLKGEAGEAVGEDSFLSRPAFQRLLILAAGVIMNWWLAFAIFATGLVIGVPMSTDGLPPEAMISGQRTVVERILPDSPADKSGVRAGDRILSVDGRTFADADALHRYLSDHSLEGITMRLQFDRKGETRFTSVSPGYVEKLKRIGVGIGLMDMGIVRFKPLDAITQSVQICWRYTTFIVKTLAGMARDLVVKRRIQQDVSGPVGIAVAAGAIAQQGWWPLAQFVALLSLNLSIVNFLPIPALDGGRALFVLVEWLRRKRNNAHVENALHQIGFVTLLALVALVTVRDIGQHGGWLLQGIRSIIGS